MDATERPVARTAASVVACSGLVPPRRRGPCRPRTWQRCSAAIYVSVHCGLRLLGPPARPHGVRHSSGSRAGRAVGSGLTRNPGVESWPGLPSHSNLKSRRARVSPGMDFTVMASLFAAAAAHGRATGVTAPRPRDCRDTKPEPEPECLRATVTGVTFCVSLTFWFGNRTNQFGR